MDKTTGGSINLMKERLRSHPVDECGPACDPGEPETRAYQGIGRNPSYRPTLSERLVKERQDLSHRLSVIQEAIYALEMDPEFEKHDATRAKLKAAGVYWD